MLHPTGYVPFLLPNLYALPHLTLLEQIAPYFSKVECFCFEEQKLLAGEEVDMPLLFFIDKDVLDDPACRNVDSVVLSYTFFRYGLCFCANIGA